MVKVAVIGAGNCFAGLYLGLSAIKRGEKVLSLLPLDTHPQAKDIEIVAAYDISTKKIGKKLHEAIYVYPNMVEWPIEPLKTEAEVLPAPVLDGVGRYVQEDFSPHNIQADWKTKIKRELVDLGVDVLVNFLPVGSEKATQFWAKMALETGTAFFNGIPSFIASIPTWAERFRLRGVPIIGDDMKSQLGATIVHKSLLELMRSRGVDVLASYQLNVGGNTDFKNMQEEERLKSKRLSKTQTLREMADAHEIYAGPSGYIPFLKNTKVAHMYIKGKHWAGVPVELEITLRVDDKADAAPVALEGIRMLALAKERGIGGPLEGPSAWLMKHPPRFMPESEALAAVKSFMGLDKGI